MCVHIYIKKKIFKDFLISFLYVYLCMHTLVCLCNYACNSVFICTCVYTACTYLISEISFDIFFHILPLSLDKHNYLLSFFYKYIFFYLF